jgi:hypothetical protein
MSGRLRIVTSGTVANIVSPMASLASETGRKALALAINHTLARAETQVKRALVKQTGLKAGAVKAELKRFSANAGRLEGEIKGSGRYHALAEFGARRTAAGIKAAPWNTARVFPSTFFVQRYGANVFKRTTRHRFPVKALYGPAIPKEMVKDAARQSFEQTVEARLPDRVAHELTRLLGR